MSKDGGRAFPSPYWDRDRMRYLDEGMSLRDYFAAAALQAILTSDDPAPCVNQQDPLKEQLAYAKIMSATAYRFADAMLAERDK